MMMGFGNSSDEVTAARGFTLAELMVTLALVAILATIAAPSVNQSIRQADGRSTARAVANELRKARDHAMSRGRVVYAKIEKNEGQGSRGQVDLRQTNHVQTSCRLADSGSTSSIETTEIAHLSGELSMQGASQLSSSNSDSWHDSHATWICFSPTGEVLQGHTDRGDEFESCAGHAWRFWIAADSPTDLETACDPSDEANGPPPPRIQQRDERYKNNFWLIEVPYNGGIRVEQ